MITHVTSITNDLGSLVPLGVLFLTNLPRLAMPGIDAPDGWCWFDPPYTNANWTIRSVLNGQESSLSAILTDLSYLMERRYVRATYKIHRLQGIDMAVLRVYVVPSDIDGNRFLEQYRGIYRRGKGVSWHEGRYKLIMRNLIAVLDYSESAWAGKLKSKILVFSCLQPFKLFHAKDLGSIEYIDSEISFHIIRLVNGDAFKKHRTSTPSQDLEIRLSNVYDSINLKIDRTSDFLLEAQSIKGMKSYLYNYQMESIAKMLMNETQDRYNYMPHLLKLKRTTAVFFDTLNVTFLRRPELYKSPRGGILAENMGLGKTCICLALICLTKLETAMPPDRFSARNFKDYRVLPLMEQCVRLINCRSIPWRRYLDSISDACVKKIKDNPGYFYLKKEEVRNRRFSSRSQPIVVEVKLLLASTTLIVCPDNLFSQWVNEIDKHIERGALSLFEHSSTHEELPPAKELIQFDIILMSTSSFVAQNTPKSPLMKVYWKRLIIDEGHSMHQRSTRAVTLSKEIQVERRWAVTGTPTAGMTTLHIKETVDEDSSSYDVKRNFDVRDDLVRLGALVLNFFQIEPWKSSNDLWRKNIVKPFIDNSYGSTLALSSLLHDLVVRHSPDQIENDVTLPPLLHSPVFLKPSMHNKISVNLFTAVLAINAVSSEREDRDYMFHPASKVDLRRLITNLQRSTFYWTGFSVDDLKTMISISKVCLEKKRADGSDYYVAEDIELLNQSIRICKRALSNKTWRTVSTIHEMCYYIDGLPDMYAEYFSIGNYLNDVSVLGAPQCYSMQKFYFKNRFLNLQDHENSKGKIQAYTESFWKEYWIEATKKNAERVKKNDGQAIDMPTVDREFDAQTRISSLKSSPKSKKAYDDIEVIKNKSGRIDISERSTPSVMTDPSSLKRARVLGTASAKLSYLVSRLLDHQRDGVKSIVFYEFEDGAYYLSEALDLIGVDYTLYSTSFPKNVRSRRIDDFTNIIGRGHSLIMDLKLASHGLTITAATRVYFLNPVWSRSVEAQAIKRAHRIGQNQAVHVETLILKGTLEEEMFKRRQMTDDDSGVSVAEDDQIREYISKFEFLKLGDVNKAPYSDFKSGITSGVEEDVEDSEDDEDDGLLEPTSTFKEDVLRWNVPIFNKGAQRKVAKLDQPVLKPINVHVENVKPSVVRKLDFEVSQVKKRIQFENTEINKRVRFE